MIFLLLLVTLSPVTASGLDEERQIAADMDNLDCIRLFGDNSNEISSDEGVKYQCHESTEDRVLSETFKIFVNIHETKIVTKFLEDVGTQISECEKEIELDGATRVEINLAANSLADMNSLWTGYVVIDRIERKYLILGHDYRYPHKIRTDVNPTVSVWGRSGNSFKLPDKDWKDLTGTIKVIITFSGSAGEVSVEGDSMNLDNYYWTSPEHRMYLELSSDTNGEKLWTSLEIQDDNSEETTEEVVEDGDEGIDNQTEGGAVEGSSLTWAHLQMYDLRQNRVFNLTSLINRRVTVAGKTTNKTCEVLGLQGHLDISYGQCCEPSLSSEEKKSIVLINVQKHKFQLNPYHRKDTAWYPLHTSDLDKQTEKQPDNQIKHSHSFLIISNITRHSICTKISGISRCVGIGEWDPVDLRLAVFSECGIWKSLIVAPITGTSFRKSKFLLATCQFIINIFRC
ncbi:hypothetical protein ACHWQZ_G001115 [Mnemiopsis leidyi]